ncbi:MAG: hypothetical protein JNL62_23290 [Bryobacterales bacterium]|nr:hypothetical protein [Bryobacterales bacterium]
MEQATVENPDLLTRMLRNRTMRTLIAIAIFVRVMDVYYDAGKAFAKGFMDGFSRDHSVSSTPAPAKK